MDIFHQYLLLLKLWKKEKMTNFTTALLYVFILRGNKMLGVSVISLSFITEIFYAYISGWYLEHYRKELHGCYGHKRCLLPFLLLGYG